MTITNTPAPSAHDTGAPAIPFDPSNPAHQRAWQSVCNLGRVQAEERAREAAEKASQPDPEPTDTSYRMFHAYRRAKAAWELVQYAEEYIHDDVPAEINDPLSDAHTAALNAYLITPADELSDLARKLKVFRDEQIHDGWWKAQEIVEALAADCHRLAYSGDISLEGFASPAS